MRIGIAITAGALLLAGCGQGDAPVKRQPGSWTQKMEVIEFVGPGITAAQKAQMQQMMNMVSSMTVCLTPEAAAQEDVEQNLTQMGSQAGNCVVGDKKIGGGNVAFTANCQDKGKAVKMSVNGTNAPTEQNFRITVESVGAGNDGGKLVMNVSGKRQGECKPGEFTPPPKPATAPAKAAS